jgi:hypothetical protein
MGYIFLSYAREDKPVVDKIFLRMKEAGLTPWMDKPPAPYSLEGIRPGEVWDTALRVKLSGAAIVLSFLSNASISKEGYVHKEYRLALSHAMDKPENAVYLVPVLLEECEPPDYRVDSMSLRQFQWYPLYEHGEEMLIRYLRELTLSPQGSEAPPATGDKPEPQKPSGPADERLQDLNSPNPLVAALQNRIQVLESALQRALTERGDYGLLQLQSENAMLRIRLDECRQTVHRLEAEEAEPERVFTTAEG